MKKQQLICICGPTASGKTALAVELAKEFSAEIVSADSMQLYCRMDIGTAKPAMEERKGVPHYMLDMAEPGEPYSVAKYVENADKCVQDIFSRGKRVIVAGGTGLYLNALIEGNVFSGQEKDEGYRQSLHALAIEKGNEAVYALLCEVDPESAQRLHPNNLNRVIRALEVYHQTGMTLPELNRLNRPSEPKYEALLIGLCPENRAVLYDRINRRVEEMVRRGLVTEAEQLWKSGALSGTAGQAIGYKELLPYLKGEMELLPCLEKLRQNSRNYAKRQLTWFKRDERIFWLHYEKEDDFLAVRQKAAEYLKSYAVR